MEEYIKLVETLKRSGIDNDQRDLLEYRYRICKKILPDLKQFEDKNINFKTKLDYNEAIKMVGDFFKSISPDVSDMFYNSFSVENDISKYERKTRIEDWDFFSESKQEAPIIGKTVKFTKMTDEIETVDDFYNSVNAASDEVYTTMSLNGYVQDVNTIAHEFAHRFSLSNESSRTFAECPSIHTELLLYDYYKKNDILGEQEIYEMKKLKFSSYLYRIAVPTIIRKNAFNIIENNEHVNDQTIMDYIESLEEGSEDRYAMEFAIKHPEVLDLDNRQDFDYIEGVLLASYLKENNANYDELTTQMAHCTTDKEVADLFRDKYGVDTVLVENQGVRISENMIDKLAKSLHKEVSNNEITKDKKTILTEAIAESERETTFNKIEENNARIESLIKDERQDIGIDK